jgi:hypothetical protein
MNGTVCGLVVNTADIGPALAGGLRPNSGTQTSPGLSSNFAPNFGA